MNNQKLTLSAFYLALSICFAFLGCSSQTSIDNSNVATLKTQGEKVGTLPDGRSIYRYEINRGGLLSSHWIYVVSDGSSVTTNFHANKTEHVQVLIDGVKYAPEQIRLIEIEQSGAQAKPEKE